MGNTAITIKTSIIGANNTMALFWSYALTG